LPNVGPYIYTTLAFLALLGAPYIYDISSLRVNSITYKSVHAYDTNVRNRRGSVHGAVSYETKSWQSNLRTLFPKMKD